MISNETLIDAIKVQKGTYSEELKMIDDINKSIDKQEKLIAEIRESCDRIKQLAEAYRKKNLLR